MSVIAIGGQKGGSGKTTTALSLATEWKRRGRSVLLVDADPQGSARTWADVAGEAKHEAPTVVAMGASMHRPDQLPSLAASYEIAIIDCPPRHGEIQRAALMVADAVILPCGPSPVDAWALAESVSLVNEARSLRPELLVAILITRRIPRTAIGHGARQTLGDVGYPVLKSELGLRVAYAEAPAAGLGVTSYAPRSEAASEVRALCDELERMTKVARRRS